MATHTDTDHGNFRDLSITHDLRCLQVRFHITIDQFQCLVIFTTGHGESEICFTFHRLILNNHIDFNIRLCDRSQDLIRNAGLVGHAHHGDFRFIAIEGYAGDGGLFHVGVFLKRNQGAGICFFFQRHQRVRQRRQHPCRHTIVTGKFHRADLQHFGTQRCHFQHFLEGHGAQTTCIGNNPRVGGVDAIDVRVDQALRRFQCSGNRHG